MVGLYLLNVRDFLSSNHHQDKAPCNIAPHRITPAWCGYYDTPSLTSSPKCLYNEECIWFFSTAGYSHFMSVSWMRLPARVGQYYSVEVIKTKMAAGYPCGRFPGAILPSLRQPDARFHLTSGYATSRQSLRNNSRQTGAARSCQKKSRQTVRKVMTVYLVAGRSTFCGYS